MEDLNLGRLTSRDHEARDWIRPKASSSPWSLWTFSRRCSKSRSAKTKSNGAGAGDWICFVEIHGPHNPIRWIIFLVLFVVSSWVVGHFLNEFVIDCIVQAPSSRDADVALTPMLANL